MPIREEFRRHLNDVMIETMLSLREQINQHHRELVWKAQQTRNAAGLPIAYRDAAIDAFKLRVETVTDRFLETIANTGVEVDDDVERKVLAMIGTLTSARHSLSLPPGLKQIPNLSAVQRSYKMEQDRTGSLLYRKAANRIREAKLKAKQAGTAKVSTMSSSKPFTIGSTVQSLAALKALGADQQDLILLRRLVHIYPHMSGSGGLHKGNLLLPGDG